MNIDDEIPFDIDSIGLEDDDVVPSSLLQDDEDLGSDRSGLFIPGEDEDDLPPPVETVIEEEVPNPSAEEESQDDPFDEAKQTAGHTEGSRREEPPVPPTDPEPAPKPRQKRAKKEDTATEVAQATTDVAEKPKEEPAAETIQNPDASVITETHETVSSVPVYRDSRGAAEEGLARLLSNPALTQEEVGAIYYILGRDDAKQELMTQAIVTIGGAIKALFDKE